MREFSTSGFKTLTGCTNHPAPGEKFCSQHKDHLSPALTPDQLTKETLNNLNCQQTSRERFMGSGLERDNIFVVEDLFIYKVLHFSTIGSFNLVILKKSSKSLKTII